LASADIWHHRLGHPNYAVVRTVIQDNKLPVSSLKFSVCTDCNKAKSHKLPFDSASIVTLAPLSIFYADLWGPAPVYSSNGNRYYVMFTDAHTQFSWISFAKLLKRQTTYY
jgi:hypothetical protein